MKMGRILALISIWLATISVQARGSWESKKHCVFTKKFQVTVLSNLPPNTPLLSAQCWSKDDLLGHHLLAPGQNFSFGFCKSFWGTAFTCFLSWEDKGKTFDVYSSDWKDSICDRTGQCFWFAKEDGIYFSDDYPPTNLVKQFDWLAPAAVPHHRFIAS